MKTHINTLADKSAAANQLKRFIDSTGSPPTYAAGTCPAYTVLTNIWDFSTVNDISTD